MFSFIDLKIEDKITLDNCIVAEAPNKVRILYVGSRAVAKCSPYGRKITICSGWDENKENFFRVTVFIQNILGGERMTHNQVSRAILLLQFDCE